jgi:hypothetical protein
MPRIRTIKPEFWQDEKLSQMPDTTRLLFLALISMADDCGRVLDSLKVIAAFIWPNDTDDPAEAAADRQRLRDALAELAAAGRIERGETASGQRVLQIVHWDRHQRVEKPNVRGALPEIVTSQAVTDSTTNRRMSRESVANHSRPDLRPTTYDQRPPTSEQRAAREAPAIGDPAPLNRGARLTAAANKGITERFGEQPTPIRATHSSVDELLVACDAAGVPDEFAMRVLYERAKSLSLERPPRTLGYFRAALLEAWDAEQAHRQAATVAVPAGAPADVVGSDVLHRRMALKYARAGDADWQAECRLLGLDWEAA